MMRAFAITLRANHRASHAGLLRGLVAGLTALGCSTADEAPRQSLRTLSAQAAAPVANTTTSSPVESPPHALPSALPPRAREALDRGNSEFRSHDYGVALGDYRSAALAAPTSAAPFFGMYLVARKIGNTALADSALAQISRLSGSTLTTPDMQKLHHPGAVGAQTKK